MLDNPYLDTIISLVLVYATLSVLVSMINEWWNKHSGNRGKFLKASIERMINDPNNGEFGHMLYAHPMIARLRKDVDQLPSYISAETFATALTDLMGDRGYEIKTVDLGNGLFQHVPVDPAEALAKRFRRGVVSLNDGQIKRLLLGISDRCSDVTGLPDLEKLRSELGRWFDDHMDRVSGEFKDAQRYRLFGLGLFVAIALNVDTIHLSRVVFLNEPLRTSLVQRAEGVSDRFRELPDSAKKETHALLRIMSAPDTGKTKTDTAATRMKRMRTDSTLNRAVALLLGRELEKAEVEGTDSIVGLLTQWGLPVGYAKDEPPWCWTDPTAKVRAAALATKEPLLRYYALRNSNKGGWYIPLWLAGLLLTALALSAGAPFWFDALLKLVNIRRAGAKPLRADEKKEND